MVIRALCLLFVSGCIGQIADAGEDPPGAGPRSGGPGAIGEAEPLAPLTRRLTRYEYENTVRDVLGVELSDAERAELPADRPVQGFVNIASGQATLPEHVLAYSRVAEAVARSPRIDAFIDAHASCRESRCRDELVESAGAALFRRPLEDEEAADFAALFDAVEAEGVSFDESAGAVIQAMLQSPQFLYLLEFERGSEAAREVIGYEMAARLSYAVWASAPDERLYDAAASGTLDTREGVREELLRMLEDTARVERVAERFIVDWARLESLPDEDGLRGELIETAKAYYAAQVVEGRDLFALFDDGRAYLTPALAERYGVTPEGDGARAYDVGDLPGRGGLLAQPGVVAGMTNSDGGEIVARGLFLMTQLFCGRAPDPPATLQDAIDAFVAEQPPDASDRDIAEARLTRPECASCHASFDPLAYGFEQLDYRGGFRTEDEHGNVVRVDGWIPTALTGSDTELRYESFDEYMSLLTDNERVRQCLTQRQVEYVLGRVVGDAQETAIVDIAADVAAKGGDYRALMEVIVTHDLFRTAAVER